MLDREGAKRAVVIGCAIAAVGFGFWASKATTLSFGKQQIWVIVAGAGMGMMLGPANTDAVNRAGNLSYGEATGITQTIRNFGASLGPGRARHHPAVQLPLAPDDVAAGDGRPERRRRGQPHHAVPAGHGSVASIPHFVSLDFAHATQAVLYVMCGIMAFAGLVALFGLQRGRQEVAPVEDGAVPAPAGGRLTLRRRRSRCRGAPLGPAVTSRRRRRLSPGGPSRGGRNVAPQPHRDPHGVAAGGRRGGHRAAAS